MKLEFSAGGVVFRVIPAKAGIQTEKGLDPGSESGMTIEILVAQHSGHHGWVFPKGFIGDKIAGESKEATAVREVKEETGVDGEIVEPLTPVDYWYQMGQEKHHKTVYYYIMKYLGGDIKDHDWEMENVEWLALDEVENRLTFPSDKKVWLEAKEKINELVTKQE